ncbi:5-hydroxytryptamine receptor 1F-like [Pecten maximus]|uniref:5-hydroxytryptamine receptor 1F-like n=1 Tax=Pecten maximus TaxID=6579 RepID=UPI00145866BF|nr:5-hydroxytryptamine receptor 1F-like [Pecten maximus]
MNSSTNATYSLEEEDWEEFRNNGIPISVFLAVLCVVGTVGNVHVFLVYLLRYKSNIYKTFILCLAAVDFLGCTFCIPASLYIIRHPNTLQSSAFCKMSRALTYFVGAYSLLLLDCIAVERYRKVCQATRAQFTLQMTRIVCVVVCLFVIVVITIPVVVIYGLNQKTTKAHSLIGYECTVLELYKNSTLIKVYRGFVFFIFVLLLIISVVLYTLVGRKIYAAYKNKHRKTRTKSCMSEFKQSSNKSISTQACGNKNTDEGETDDVTNSAAHVTSETHNHVMTSCPRDPDVKDNHSGDRSQQSTITGNTYLNALNEKKRKKLERSRNITMIFLVVSIMSFGGYLPYLLTTLIRNISRSLFENIEKNNGALIFFIRWMVFFNNAINPIVYGFMDKKVRKELSHGYVKMMRCCFSCRNGY